MTKPRSHYVDAHHARYYHVTSRCVRRAFLLGADPLTKINHDNRKAVFHRRLKHLAQFFTIDVMGYALMSNHFHLVVRYDPNGANEWCDEEVARRWCSVFHGLPLDATDEVPASVDDYSVERALHYHDLLLDPERIARCRTALSSLSRFMQHLKQPFAVWANRQDRCKGHFFEARFYSGVLLEEADLLACMAYVDLNPVEAGMARSLKAAAGTSIHERLYRERFDSTQLEAYLAPLWADDGAEGGAEPSGRIDLRCRLVDYAQQLNLAVVFLTHQRAEMPSRLENWMARLLNRERNKRPSAEFYDYAY